MKKNPLFVPRKTTKKAHPGYGTDMRAIESWALNVPTTGGVTRIIAGTNITISPAGGTGVVTINSTAGGTYKSLTGPGKTATPGALTQLGSFTITGPTFKVTASTKIALTASSPTPRVTIVANRSSGSGTAIITLHATNAIILRCREGPVFVTTTTGTTHRMIVHPHTHGWIITVPPSGGTNRSLTLHTKTILLTATTQVAMVSRHATLDGSSNVTITSTGGTVGLTSHSTLKIKANTGPVTITGAHGVTIISQSGHLLELTSATIRLKSTKTGFFNTTPVTKPTITGSRGGNAAVASIASALAALGLVTNTTT